ncbi:hypothetical protein EFP18_00705 (plasmid) [Burkholderia glumae]|nr:hypothetical protein EFP18_00705 [Burkholderia glumae]
MSALSAQHARSSGQSRCAVNVGTTQAGRFQLREYGVVKRFDRAAMIQLADEYLASGNRAKARSIYQKINERDPGELDLICKELVCAIRLCHWQRYDYLQRAMRDSFRYKGGLVVGEPLLASPYFSAADLLDVNRRHMATLPMRPVVGGYPERPRHIGCERIRVGFLGADFYNQATLHLMVGMLEEHDRSRYEYIAYDSGPCPLDDPIRQRAINAFDQFNYVHDLDNDALGEAIGSDNLDILIFIRNLTDPRLGVLAQRRAPIQVAYLYNPSGFGAPAVDYLIADAVVVPPGHERFYSEQIARLPFCYQPNDQKRPLPQPCTRAELGLPEDRFVLANLGSPYKITPAMFDCWCTILRQHPQCVLWLLETEPEVVSNLRCEASLRGIDPDRLHFSPLDAIVRHISRLACADLMLDTYPYGGHTGSSDALWAGTPVLTLAGETFASRVAASLLHAAGLASLATTSEADYIRMASHLIEDKDALAAYRRHLVSQRMSLPLFDTRAYAADFERLLIDLLRDAQGRATQMHEHHSPGLDQ